MKEWDDKHIDQMMKEAAQNYAPEFSPAAWANMQQAMQAEGLTTAGTGILKPLWKYLGILLLALLFVTGGVYYFTQQSKSELSVADSSETREAESGFIAENKNVKQPEERESVSEQAFPEQEEIAKETSEKVTAATTGQKNSESTEENLLTQATDQVVENSVENRDAATTSSVPSPAARTDVNDVDQRAVDKDEGGGIATMVESVDSNSEYLVIADSASETNTLEAELMAVDNDAVVLLDLVEEEKAFYLTFIRAKADSIGPEALPLLYPEKIELESGEVIDMPSRRRWAVSALLSPDFSGASIDKLKGTGWDTGLMAEYFISNKLSISTGAVYSTKKYFVDDDFSGYTSRWPGRDAPSEIDASCNVIDIPVNLRYYISNGGSIRLFVSTGVSSYFMLTENYLYEYDGAPYNNWRVTIDNENKHYFGLLNFSFGIQKQLRQGLYLIGEPHYTSPITGIGAGQVSLKSSGFRISIKKDL